MGFFLLSSVLFKFFFFRFEFCFPVFKFLILFLVLLIQSQLLEVAAKPAKIKLPDRAQSFVFVLKLWLNKLMRSFHWQVSPE